MTDIGVGDEGDSALERLATSLPNRLGVGSRFDDGELRLELRPAPEHLHHGVLRASVVSYLIDGVSGIDVDPDPDQWTMTTDMTVRMRPDPAPARISAASTILRNGKRSVACEVQLTDDDGSLVATGAIGFARFPRKPTDPPKPFISRERAPVLFPGRLELPKPLREEAGIVTVDAAAGVVEVPLTDALRNPAGTLQGAMVSLVAEAAAEDLAQSLAESPMVVTDLDLRYLAQTRKGPVRTRTLRLSDDPTGPIRVELIDTSTDTLTSLVYARAERVHPS